MVHLEQLFIEKGDTMGFFTKDTKEDALEEIKKINRELRAINALIHLNYNMIDGRNRYKIIIHFNNIVKYYNSYKKIKNSFPLIEQLELEGEKIELWDGSKNDITAWEFYFYPMIKQLENQINY